VAAHAGFLYKMFSMAEERTINHEVLMNAFGNIQS